MAKNCQFWAIFGHFASTLNAYISASFAFYELKFSGKTLKEVSKITKPVKSFCDYLLERRRGKTTKKAIFGTLMVSHKKTRLSHPPTHTSKDAPWSKLSIKV